MNSRIEAAWSRLTYRKVPFLILYEVALVAYLCFSPNPYQRQAIAGNAWFFALSFLFLIPLAFFERRRGLPLPYVESMSLYDYFVAGGLCFIGLVLVLMVFRWLLVQGLFPFALTPLNPSNWFTVAWEFQFGIVEESFKMGMTNLFGLPALWMRGKVARKVWVFFAGTISIVLWAYSHILTRAYFGPYALPSLMVAGVIGIVFLTVTIWKRNYLPAILVHGIYDVALALGYLH